MRPLLAAAGETIGFVRAARSHTPRWLRWLERPNFEVFEFPDSSLVFALRRSWGWPAGWQVLDADERHVGTLRGSALMDGLGYFLGVVEAPDREGRGRFLAMQGHELGCYARESGGTRLIFGPELEGNPFARMLLLGAVLVQDP
jgi:hypothetical protein